MASSGILRHVFLKIATRHIIQEDAILNLYFSHTNLKTYSKNHISILVILLMLWFIKY
jgi:hypothetical protein